MCIFVRSLHLLIAKLNSKPYGNKRNEMRITTLVSLKLGKSRTDVYFSSISQTREYLTRYNITRGHLGRVLKIITWRKAIKHSA